MKNKKPTVISHREKITLVGISPHQLNAKVDTGADISSLHATNIDIGPNGSVEFKFKSSKFQAKVKDYVTIKNSDGESEARPIVALTVIIGNKSIPAVEFTLNDRSTMEHKVLLGLNFISAGNFTVTPDAKNKSTAKDKKGVIDLAKIDKEQEQELVVSDDSEVPTDDDETDTTNDVESIGSSDDTAPLDIARVPAIEIVKLLIKKHNLTIADLI